MSTKSTIWCEFNEFYMGSYCHWDGYLEHVGLNLFKYFNDITTIQNMIRGGDISSIDNDHVTYCKGNFRICSKNMKTKDIDDIMNCNSQEFNYLYTRKEGWRIFWDGEWKGLGEILEKEGII